MIRRTSKKHIKKLLAENPSWKCADFGCKRGAWDEAQSAVDLGDLSGFYAAKGKEFYQADICHTSFANKQFDFIIMSHIFEHIHDPAACIAEIQRVGKRGYIEVPTPLFCNLIFGNDHEHPWFVTFDDTDGTLLFKPRVQHVLPMFTPDQWDYMLETFRQSAVTELYLENDIPFRILNAEPPHPWGCPERFAQRVFGAISVISRKSRRLNQIAKARLGRVFPFSN